MNDFKGFTKHAFMLQWRWYPYWKDKDEKK